MSNFWIGVVSKAHVQNGVRGGFIQLNHGKKAAVQRLKAGDMLAMYSPRTDYPDGAALQAFTAIGTVASGEVYQVEMSPDFKPFRVDVQFHDCHDAPIKPFRVDVQFHDCHDAPIKPLIDRLSFIRDKMHWGAAFRFGYLRVPEADFQLIAEAMGRAK